MLPNLGIAPRKFSFEPTQTFLQEVKLSKTAVKTTIAEDVTTFKFYLPWVLEYITLADQDPVLYYIMLIRFSGISSPGDQDTWFIA